MYEKIKISVEIEEALKFFMNLHRGMSTNDQYDKYLEKRGPFKNPDLTPLNIVSRRDFFFLLHGWYEVNKPTFEVGDWVYGGSSRKRYYKVLEKRNNGEVGLRISYLNERHDQFEKVTEPWKIALLEAGRTTLELRAGDKFTTYGGFNYSIDIVDDYLIENFKKVEYFYPVESRIEVKNQ